jgi:hypothetical protein
VPVTTPASVVRTALASSSLAAGAILPRQHRVRGGEGLGDLGDARR